MWKFFQPVEVIFGNGEAVNLGAYLEQKNLSKALLIADPIVVELGLAEKLKEAAGGRILDVITDVEPNPTVHNVNRCVAKLKQIEAECVIAIGGGSSIDCAKAVCGAAFMNCSGEELMNGKAIVGALPLIAIPTTAGTGSEVTPVTVLSWKEEGKKAALGSPHLFPVMAIVDPVLTYTCPKSVTAISGIDVIAHALDSLCSVKSNDITASIAIKATRIAFDYLAVAVSNGQDLVAREQMAQASVLAGLAFAQTGTTGSHACSYILTSKYDIPHGEACAFTLDAWYEINAQANPKLNDYAKEMGFKDASDLAIQLNQLKKQIGLRTTLAEIGIRDDEIDGVVKGCLAAANMPNNIAQIGFDGVKEIFLSKK